MFKRRYFLDCHLFHCLWIQGLHHHPIGPLPKVLHRLVSRTNLNVERNFKARNYVNLNKSTTNDWTIYGLLYAYIPQWLILSSYFIWLLWKFKRIRNTCCNCFPTTLNSFPLVNSTSVPDSCIGDSSIPSSLARGALSAPCPPCPSSPSISAAGLSNTGSTS